MQTTPSNSLVCDGCGQPASPEHIARRLQRLEWTTRYRPIHISALLLGGVSPAADADFLYAGRFEGEAGRLLQAIGIAPAGKPAETVLSEFQRGGFFLTHVLECPLELGQGSLAFRESLFAQRVSAVATRIRRSIKPKRVILISEWLEPLAARLSSASLECPVVLDNGNPFCLDASGSSGAVQRLRAALAGAVTGK